MMVKTQDVGRSKIDIVFPVTERFIRDNVPASVRYYCLYAWGLWDNELEQWEGFAGIHTGEVFDEFGSLWIRERARGQGWARKLTEARVQYVLDHPELFSGMYISRIRRGYTEKPLLDAGFGRMLYNVPCKELSFSRKELSFSPPVIDKGGDPIYFANQESLVPPFNPPKVVAGTMGTRREKGEIRPLRGWLTK